MTAHHIQSMSNTFYMYEVNWYKYEVDERSQSLHNSIIHVKNQRSLLTKPEATQGGTSTSGVRTYSYDCPPHDVKHVKHILYV
jgi:hypothetical protein